MRKTLFIIYTWFTAVLWGLVLLWFSSDNAFADTTNPDDSLLLERTAYFLGFGLLFILIYRALINTFRLTIERLSYARNKKEAAEDSEFVLIVETLLMSNAILLSIIAAVAINTYLEETPGRKADIYLFLTNTLAIVVFGLVTYSWPILSKIEARIAKLID